MKVPSIAPATTTGTQRTRRAGPSAGGRFRDHLSKTADTELESLPAVAGVSAAATILAAQEVDEDADQGARSRLVRRGEDILDRLEEIRRDILFGAVPRERLENLAHLLRQQRAAASDPRLIAILDEIELRAAVEIAKLSRGV